jgi:hypothetical protein
MAMATPHFLDHSSIKVIKTSSYRGGSQPPLTLEAVLTSTKELEVALSTASGVPSTDTKQMINPDLTLWMFGCD